jgi:hypothetical protein
VALALTVTTGCTLIPPTGPSEFMTRQAADGRVRQFVLGPQSSGTLTLGKARNLLFAVSTGAAASRAESFRIQDASAEPRDPHGRFRESFGAIAAEAAADPHPRLQAVEPPPAKGETRSFWVNIGNSLASGDRKQQAKLIETTEHAYFFVDTHSYANSPYHANPAQFEAQVKELARAFEANIHPKVTQAFGPPPTPGIDQDSRVYVVLSPAVDNFGADAGLMGYFWNRDLYPASTSPGNVREHSNEKEVIFLTDQIFKQKAWTIYGTLAHEFTHLVVYNQKVIAPNRSTPEETWLDEGLAMLAMDLCGYGLRHGNDEIARDIARFQAAPEKYSLTDWFRNPNGFSYGLSFLFTRYLYDRFSEGLIRDLLKTPQVGVSGVGEVLAPRNVTFQDVFSDWTLANAISGMGVTGESRYGYASEIKLRETYGAVQLTGIQPRPLNGPADVTAPARPWSTGYYLLGAPQERAWTMDVRPGLVMLGGTVALP